MKEKYLRKSGRRNRHHILAKSRGGRRNPENLILLDETKHSAFHLIFGNRTFEEAARLLLRAAKLKRGGKAWKEAVTETASMHNVTGATMSIAS